MSVRPHGPDEYPIGDLEPRHFESLVFLLARATDSLVVPVRARDHGLDARLPDGQGRTIRGWQAKRYTGDINWSECRNSVRRALAFWRPPRITFCFPRNLSGGEQDSFTTELIEGFPEVRLDFWSGAEMQRLMRDTDGGQRAVAWLFANPTADRDAMLRALAVGGELEDTQQAAGRQAVIQEFMNRDPHVHYTMISRSPGGPVTPPADPTFLSVTLIINGQEVRVDASARYDGALEDLGAVPQLAFTDDDEGRRALEIIERLTREGGRETISAGLGTLMPTVPLGLRGLMPETGVWGGAEVIAGTLEPLEAQPVERAQAVVVRADDIELGFVLVPAEPLDGWDGTLHGAAGGVELFFSVRGPATMIESRLDWRYTRGEGTGLEQLLGVRIMLAALRGALIELVRPHDGQLLMSGALDTPDDATDWQTELASREQFLGYAAELEAWLGTHLRPPAEPSANDAGVLSSIIPLIRQPEAIFTWKHVDLAVDASRPDDDKPFQFALLQPLHVRLFEEDVFLGMQWLHLPEGRIEGEPGHFTIVPVGPTGTGTSRLYRPDEVPPEAAIPPSPRTVGTRSEDSRS